MANAQGLVASDPLTGFVTYGHGIGNGCSVPAVLLLILRQIILTNDIP